MPTRGIVMCAGGKTLFPRAVDALDHLRGFHNVTTPVELVAADEEELELGRQALRSSSRRLPQAVEEVVLSLRLRIPANVTRRLRGCWMKPLALASSRFVEVMLLDVDVIFFCSPELLWASEAYRRTGGLFFHDFLHLWRGPKRGQMVSEPESFLRSFVANFSCEGAIGRGCDGPKRSLPSPQFEQLNLVRHARGAVPTFHEQDSSVILWHRRRHPEATEILRVIADPRLPWQQELVHH
eukprot:7378600-Prymnesium_polylepis.1